MGQFRWLEDIFWESLPLKKTYADPLTRHLIRYIRPYVKQKGELVKISMNLPPDLWRKLKFRALKEDTTATDILVRLAKEYFAKTKDRKRRRLWLVR